MGHLCPSAQCAAMHGRLAFRAQFGTFFGTSDVELFDFPMWSSTTTTKPSVGIARKRLDHKPPAIRRRVA